MDENKIESKSDKTTDEIFLSHDDLKEIGRQYLKEQGYKEDEIEKEYTIKFHDRSYRIDVVGLKNKRVVVAIECGSVSYEKMTVLTNIIRKVVHIPFHNQVVDLNLINLNKEKISLEKEIKELKGRHSGLEIKMENLIPFVNSLEGATNVQFNEILINYMLKNMEYHPYIRQIVDEKIYKVGMSIFGEVPFVFTHSIVEEYIKKRFSLVNKDEFEVIRGKLFKNAVERLFPDSITTEMRFWSIDNGYRDFTLGLVDTIILLNLIVTGDNREKTKCCLNDIILEGKKLALIQNNQ